MPISAWSSTWQCTIQMPGLSALKATSYVPFDPTSTVTTWTGVPESVTPFPARSENTWPWMWIGWGSSLWLTTLRRTS